jgi:hypothetical protein
MDPQLQRAYDALQQADAAGNKEDAQQIADYIRELQAQQQNKAMLEAGDESMMRNPMAAGAVGAVAGPVAGKVLETAYSPKGVPTGAPTTVPGAGSPGQKWAAKTGYGAGTGATVENVVEEFKKREGPLGKGKVTSKITGGALGGPAAMEQIAAKEADAARFAQMRAANQMAAQKASSAPSRIAQATAGKMPLLLKSAAGAGAGMQGADAYNRRAEGDYLGAGIGAIGAAGSAASLIPHPVTRIGGTAIGMGAGALNAYLDYLKGKAQPQQPAAQPQPMKIGGLAGYARGKAVKEGVKAAHEYGGQATKKLSDWAQNYMDQYLVPTQADRMGMVGGPSYSANQLALPQYRGRAWGSGNQSTASMISNLAKDPRFGGVENQIFTPILGKDTMHQSNKIVFDRMMEEFYKDPSKLTPELRAKINDYIQSGGAIRGKPQGFEPISNFDIADKEQVKELGNTFKNRGLIATHGFGGVDIGGRKAQIIPYNQILADTMDPTVAGAKTFSVGPRAFSLTGDVENVPRPDLNAAYPYQLLGKDLGLTYTPTPSEFALIDFHRQWRKDTGKNTPLKSGALPQPGYFEHTTGYIPEGASKRTYPRQRITEEWIKELQRSGHAEGGPIQHFDGGGKAGVLPKVAKHSISQYKKIAEALEEYLKGNITKQQQMAVTRQYLPIRQWSELPPEYTDEQIINALSSNQLDKALAPVPVGKQTGNRLDINAYTKNNPPVFVDTVHDINDKNKVISYNRTGHLRDVDFKSLPNSAVLMGLGTKEQALTPMGAQMGKSKAPIAMIRGTNVGTSDNEVRRMMAEMLNDPNYTQIGMDPRVGSQFYDKATDRPIWTSGEKFQIGPLVMVPKKDIEVTDWLDPRLELKDFPGKRFKEGGSTTPAWQRSEGKSPSGGLNALGRASYKRETGGELKAPQPEGGSRKKSFCARMGGMKKKLTSSKTANDPDSRINKALRKWKC